MAARVMPAPANPCCAAFQLRCSKLEEKRNALRQGCHILKDQLSRLEADNVALKKAYDEERAQADHNRELKEKETAFRISVESKVAELESQLSSLQQAGFLQSQNLDKELVVLKGIVSEREVEIDCFKQRLEDETRKANAERELKEKETTFRISVESKVAELESQLSSLQQADSLQAQNSDKKLMVLQGIVFEREVEIDRIKRLLEDETKKANAERENAEMERQKALWLNEALEAAKNIAKETCTCNQAEAKTVDDLESTEATLLKVESLQKELLALKSFHESAEAGFAVKLSEKEADLNHLRDLLEVEKSRADVEQKKAATLQETLELEKSQSLKYSNLAQAEAKKAKESLLRMDRLKNEVSRLTLEQSKSKDMNMKYEAEKQNVLSERQRADAEKEKAVELKKFADKNEKRAMEEKSNSERLLQQVEEERQRADAEKEKAVELKKLAEENEKRAMEEKSNSERLLQQVEEERQCADAEKEKAVELKKLAEENEKRSMEEKSNSERLLQQVEEERQRADAEKEKAVELKRLAEENEKRSMEEKSNSERLLQQVEEERQKVETLQKQVQELFSYGKSTASAHSDNSDLKEAHLKLEAENRRLIKEKKRMERVQGQELKRLAEENVKKVMEERSNSKHLAQQMDAEKEKMKSLQQQVQELSSASKSTASVYSDHLKIKEAYLKLEDQNRMLIREKKQIEAEMGEVDDLRKLSEANEKRYFEEKCRADRTSHDLETGKQKIKELEEELRNLKLSVKLVGSSTLPSVPDVSISSPILLHEQLKLEKKRLKHAKQVMKFEKNRNSVLQCELGKLKQDFVRTVQHLDMLEKTFCGGAQAVDKSTKSSDLSELQRLCLNKMLLGSSYRCTSGSTIPVAVYSQPDNGTESPSGITTKLHPLVGGGPREISPSSVMDSSAASFPDKQLLGSQEQVVGSLATSIIAVDGKTNLLATISKHSDHGGKRKYSAHGATMVDNSSGTPLDNLCAPRQKRKKLLHEFESLKYMQIENRRLHEESEKKLSKLHRKFNKLMPGQMENAGYLLPDTVAAEDDEPCRKRKASPKPEETLDHSHSLAKQIKGNKLLAPAPLPPIKERGSGQPFVDHISDQDTLLIFEEQIQGNVMKLLELDNEADEELFRTAIENPLTPTLPIINCENSGRVGVDPSRRGVVESSQRSLLIGKDSVVCGDLDAETNDKSKSYDAGSNWAINNHIDMERNKENDIGVSFGQVGNGTKVTTAPIPISNSAEQTDNHQSGMTGETIPLFCILLTHMEDINRISMMLFATRRCSTQCFMHSQIDKIIMELLTSLASEKLLTPREKVCVFFSLTMHHLLQVSSNESEGSLNQGFLCSFPSHFGSVLSDVKNRGILAESFCFSELLCLFEDFVCQRRIIFCGDKDTEENNFTLRFDILLEGKKVLLYEKIASTHEVFAGSVIFSSICLAVGQISILLDVSFKVLQMWPADSQLILYILHGFAFVCGERYFLTNNYSIQMEVVKSMVNVLENAHEVDAATICQSDSKTCHRFLACARCPFAKSLRPLDILSMLVEELGKHASVPMGGVDSSSSLSIPDYEPNKDISGYIDIMSLVELISIIMCPAQATMDLSSEKESDFSEFEINNYVAKPYKELEEGKFPVRKPNGALRCPFSMAKKKQEHDPKLGTKAETFLFPPKLSNFESLAWFGYFCSLSSELGI